ncbi:AIG2-like protein D [Phragmites australis]|uniref:AIG2-like protein D n=1 Tax=Phragmites australis TaxID=29695 RepID=UPI002D79BBBF|nr:AIG2-like protein D [Phragmites australis]
MAPTPPPAAAAAAVKGGAHIVFVYGSLMADEVVRAILKRVPPAAPALLPNYHRFNIKDRIYPAILPVENKKVAGRVIMGVTDEELQVLDAFEDVEYTRRRVEISLTDSLETMLADTYVWSDAEDPNLYGEWDFEEWTKLHMKDFLAMTNGFMHGLEQPESKTRVGTYQSFMQQQ